MIKTQTEDHEERTAHIGGEDGREASIRNISDQALKIVSQGARANPESENTVVVAEVNGETTVYRIFRRRHVSGDPLAEADRWIRRVKKHCTSTTEELKATAVWTEADRGNVLVGISGREIVAKEEAGAGQLMTAGPLTPGPEAPVD